jgi:hypothetical protein
MLQLNRVVIIGQVVLGAAAGGSMMEGPWAAIDLAVGPADGSSELSQAVRNSLAILTLLSGNLDLLWDRLDDGKRKEMVHDLRQQTRVLNGLVVGFLEPAHPSPARLDRD